MGQSSNDLVQCMKRLKDRILNGDNLEKPFEDLVDLCIGRYGLNSHVWEADLSRLCETHSFLMSEINKLTITESELYEKDSLRQTMSFKEFAGNGYHNKAHQRITPLNKDSKYVFVGDVHSDPICIYKLLSDINFVKNYGNQNAIHLVFTGDYVDRGKNHLETLSVILLLKYLFADQVTLLQGNHDGGRRLEDGTIELPYRLFEEEDQMDYFPLFCDALSNKNRSFSDDMTDKYLDFFSNLPVIASIVHNDTCYLAVHGGIPRARLDLGKNEESFKSTSYFDHLNSLSDFTDGQIKDYLGVSVIFNMLWSDPDRNGEALKYDKKRFRFTEAQLHVFLERFGVDYIIRGHEAHEEGVVSYYGGLVYTNFASGPLSHGTDNDSTAYDFVKPHILILSDQGLVPVQL